MLINLLNLGKFKHWKWKMSYFFFFDWQSPVTNTRIDDWQWIELVKKAGSDAHTTKHIWCHTNVCHIIWWNASKTTRDHRSRSVHTMPLIVCHKEHWANIFEHAPHISMQIVNVSSAAKFNVWYYLSLNNSISYFSSKAIELSLIDTKQINKCFLLEMNVFLFI